MTDQCLKGTQNSIILKGPSLYHDMRPQFLYRVQTHHPIQCILHDRKTKSGYQPACVHVFILYLMYLAVHQYGAMMPQIQTIWGVHSLLHKFIHGESHGLSKGFQKQAAAGSTGTIQNDFLNAPLSDADILHILSADIQQICNLRAEETGSL